MAKPQHAEYPSTAKFRASTIVLIMMLASFTPVFFSTPVSAHAEPSGVTWPLSGSNDTGWVTLDALGANPLTGNQATATWDLSFAPGAVISNVSFQIRTSGANNTVIDQPLLMATNTGDTIFDWSEIGTLGRITGFDSGNPYNGRLSPMSDSGATITLPSDATITDLILQTLAPADPAVSLIPVNLDISSYAVHPDDGRMFIAMNDQLLVLDAIASPSIIDVISFENIGSIQHMAIEDSQRLLLLLMDDGSFYSVDLDTSEVATSYPAISQIQSFAFDTFFVSSTNGIFAASDEGLFQWNGSGWSTILSGQDLGTNPTGDAHVIFEHNNVLYTTFEGAGVTRYDLSSNTQLSSWTTANNLHSDDIRLMMLSGNQLLFGSADNGIGRYDWSAGFWLSTWNSANWLNDDLITGLARIGDDLFIMNGDKLQIYNSSSGVFSGSHDLSDFDLTSEGKSMLYWPASGFRSPSSDSILLNDGSGLLSQITPALSSMYARSFRLASGPTTSDMGPILELNGILYIGAKDGTGINRYDVNGQSWLPSWPLSDDVLALTTDGTDLFIATSASDILQYTLTGSEVSTWSATTDGSCWSAQTIGSMDVSSTHVAVTQTNGRFSILERSSNNCASYTNTNGLDTSFIGDVLLFEGKALIASEDLGVLRYDILNDTFLEPWGSTGINGVNDAPVAVLGSVLYLGLPGYGVARKDLATNEILTPFTAVRNGLLPSNQIYALEAAGTSLYIGTQQGALRWNGNTMSNFGQGTNWNTRPQQFFDFEVDGGDIYAGTNIGVCKYAQSTLAITDCQNVQDGMPNWAVYAVGVDSDTVYGGTTSGVGLIDKTTFQHDTNWGQGSQTDTAVVEIMNDIAYIGLDGLGILRYDLLNDKWIQGWTTADMLDSNGVTGLVEDIRADHLWVGTDNGFQLINTTSALEVYDINKNSALYNGNGDPFQLTIVNSIMYYHSYGSSDEVGRLDVQNFSNPGALDIGNQVGENGGDIYGMDLVGDILMISAASGQWWNAVGTGGIALFNTTSGTFGTNIEPTGQIDRVTAFESSTGNLWVAWGETRLDLYDPTGQLTQSFTQFDFPIRGIVEFDNHILFAAEDGVYRYNETSGSWASRWTQGNGLPNNAGDAFYELWTDGVNLAIGGGRLTNWGGFQEGVISHYDGSTWTAYAANSYNNIPNGYPISMDMCGGYLNIAMYNGNGGVARIDLINSTVIQELSRSNLGSGNAASVACDNANTLYVGFYQDNQNIAKYSYSTNSFLTAISTAAHNLPSDRVWYDGLAYANGQLLVGHGVGTFGNNLIDGGYTTFQTSGTSTSQANIHSQGSSVTSMQWLSASSEWLIGQAGGSSGYSHVSTISTLGQQLIVDLPGIVSGQISAMTGNGTHIWVASEPAQVTGNGNAAGAGILQGHFNSTGDIEWDYGWSLPGQTTVNDMTLQANIIYIATSSSGLFTLDTSSMTLSRKTGAIHQNSDEIEVYGNELIIGLTGTGGSSPGVQMFDMTTQQFSTGRLIAGLPSNFVNGFASSTDILYIATNGGIGRWNYSTNDWMDSITTNDGLPTNLVEDAYIIGSNLYLATSNGVVIWDESTQSVTILTTSDGLLGTSSWGLAGYVDATGTELLVISHDGAGAERPGVSFYDPSTNGVASTHMFDQLPSNTVSAIARDWWGVHIATDVGPMVHYNSTSGEFENGAQSWQFSGWPLIGMQSDGSHLITLTNDEIAIIDATTSMHQIIKSLRARNIVEATVSSTHIWATTQEGLIGWELSSPSFPEVQSESMRRALPLTLRAFNNGAGMNVTTYTHPGIDVTFIDSTNPFTLDPALGSVGVHGLMFQAMPLIFTSDVSGAATWASLQVLNYDATLDLNTDPMLAPQLQTAIDTSPLFNNTRHVQFNLYSPNNGSMGVRLIYDYTRTDSPIEIDGLVDRPDDGGGALTASWTLNHDEDFARYLLFAHEGPWNGQPTQADLLNVQPDKTVSLHSRLMTDLETAEGITMKDNVDYYAVVVTEYNDGRWGPISDVFGPAHATDEVPSPPKWAMAKPVGNDGNDGEIDVEWERCSARDLASTHLFVSTTQITDVVGLTPQLNVGLTEGNSTVMTLTPGAPFWIGLTCVDESGQEDKANALIIGPVVPTGELNDEQAPQPLTGVYARDVPNDEGGQIEVGWDRSNASDCAFYTVYIRIAAEGEPLPTSIDASFSQAKIVNSCMTNSTKISQYDGVPLIDGQEYWVGVVAFDLWLNGNLEQVDIQSVTPFQDIIGSGTKPDRITTLKAFDHPNDDGTAIDVVWSPSSATDFSFYTVWVADSPVSDVSNAFAAFGTDQAVCGCFSFNKQWIDEETNPIELTITSALYSQDSNPSLSQSIPKLIQPNIQLYVAVTVHDIKGNVHLTELTQVTVTPFDNTNDVVAPNRVSSISVTDKPMDDGRAILVDFELGPESDIVAYEVYAATFDFDDVTGLTNGPMTPVMTLGRNPSLPISLSLLAGDTPVTPGIDIWVCIVVRDSSGNAFESGLICSMGQSIDNGVSDSGSYLPDIEGVTGSWLGEENILMEWVHSFDARVRGYRIYISSTSFTDTDDASLVGDVKASNSFLITPKLFDELSNDTSWYVAVVAYDDLNQKETAQPVTIAPLTGTPSDGKQNENSGAISVDSLLKDQNLLMLSMIIITLVLLIIVMRIRGAKSSNKDWNLQEATWGLSAESGWDAPLPPPQQPPIGISPEMTNDIFAAAQRVQDDGNGRTAYVPSQPVLQPQQPSQQPAKIPEIDTSFLDDLF